MSIEHNSDHDIAEAAADQTSGFGRFQMALIVGAVTAVVCGVGWAAIAYYANYELGIVAWGIGAVIAVAMLSTAREQTLPLAVAALLLIAGSLALGKVLAVQWVMDDLAIVLNSDEGRLHHAVSEQMQDDYDFSPAARAWFEGTASSLSRQVEAELDAFDEAVEARIAQMTPEERETLITAALAREAVYDMMWEQHQFSETTEAWFNSPDLHAPPEVQAELDAFDASIAERVDAMSDDERAAVIQDYDPNFAFAMSPLETLRLSLSPWDYLWFGLALFTGWRICTEPEG